MNDTIKKEIQAKYDKKRDFLVGGLKRAQFEETIHLKQENYKRYDRLYTNFSKDLDMDVRKMTRVWSTSKDDFFTLFKSIFYV